MVIIQYIIITSNDKYFIMKNIKYLLYYEYHTLNIGDLTMIDDESIAL